MQLNQFQHCYFTETCLKKNKRTLLLFYYQEFHSTLWSIMAHDRLLLSVECRPSHQEEAAVTKSFIQQWKKFVTDRGTDITSNHLSINLHILFCLLLSTHLGKSTPDMSYFCTLIGRDAGLHYIHHVHLATCAFIKKKNKTVTSLFTQLCVLFDVNKSLSLFFLQNKHF